MKKTEHIISNRSPH